jgi:pimeloyl-ACP methyl ester carboxylesterase
MTTAKKPTLVFVPGAWHPPSCYDIIIKILSSPPYSYPCVAITTPTVGAEPPILTLQHDVDAIRAVTTVLADEGKEILLVMHSYGGLPGSQSCEGLSKTERERQGKKGGVIALVYIAAFVFPEGTTRSTRESLPPIIDVKVSNPPLSLSTSAKHSRFFKTGQRTCQPITTANLLFRATTDAFSIPFLYFTMTWSPPSLLSMSLHSLTIRFQR